MTKTEESKTSMTASASPGPERFYENFSVCPHEQAPLFSQTSLAESKQIIQQAMSEISSPNPALYKDVLDILRQTCLVNLFFCIKFILGPWMNLDYLNYGLQLDMANMRQSDACMSPGSRFGFCIFRGSGKTDILTIGGSIWEILRDPNISILVVNATQPRAAKFVHAIRMAFMINPVLEILFPRHCAWKDSVLWNTERFISPARTKFSKEPTCSASGCMGSTEGDRADLVIGDDLIGLDDLTSENLSSASMSSKITWFLTAEKASMKSLKSRFLLAFTTFGAESLYSYVFKNIKQSLGYKDLVEEYPPGGSRKWTVYFRDVLEYGRPTLPEVQTEESLEDLRKANPALYYSQYRMLPQDGGQLEFKDFPVGQASLMRSKSGEFVIVLRQEDKLEVSNQTGSEPPWPQGDEFLRLEDLTVSAALDPAGTDKSHATSKTSLSAIHVWARDWFGRTFLVYEDCGFYGISELFQRVEACVEFFGGALPWIGVEKAAMQKIIRPMLERERDRLWRGKFINFIDIPFATNKEAEIRFTLGPILAQGLVFVCRGTGQEFLRELRLFPASHRKDALDAAKMAISKLFTPPSPQDRLDRENQEESILAGKDPVTGY